MIARVTPHDGEAFELHWEGGRVVADSDSAVAAQYTAYLNGTPELHLGEPHEGVTDGHYVEKRPLRSEQEFLLTVGSLADRFAVSVELLGELSAADHEELLDNPAADAAIAEMAVERAVRRGMSRAEAIELYGIPKGEGV